MNINNLLKQLFPPAVLILGALICAASFFPELKTNPYCIAAIIFVSGVIFSYIVTNHTRSGIKKKDADQPLNKEECWIALVIHYLTTEVEINSRKEAGQFLQAVFRRIDHLHQFKNTFELRKIIASYIISPREQVIESITPYCDPDQLAQFKTESFQSLFDTVQPKIVEKLEIHKM